MSFLILFKNEDIITNYCFNSSIQLDCTLSLVTAAICTIIIVINIFAAIRVHLATKYYLKFEQYVLYSSIVESLLNIIGIVYVNIFLLHCIHFLQMIVVIFITRRFLKVYKGMEHSNHPVHRIFYVVFIVINSVFFAVTVLVILIDTFFSMSFLIQDKYWFDILTLAGRVFSFICTSISFKVGRDVKK